MKYTQKPVSKFPNNVLLQSHENCILLSFHMNINFLNVFQTSPFCPYCVPDIATWSYQTRRFHLRITSWHIFPVHHFTLAPFFAFSRICLTYINKSFVMKMSCLLPRGKLLRVTFFMKRSYLLPHANFKLPYLPNQAHWDPGICTQLRSSHIHSIHQKSRDFIYGNFVYLALICVVWFSRGRAGKKVTAVTFFCCPTVIWHEMKNLTDSVSMGWCKKDLMPVQNCNISSMLNPCHVE